MRRYTGLDFVRDVYRSRSRSRGKKPKLVHGSNNNDPSVYRTIGENRDKPFSQAPVLT